MNEEALTYCLENGFTGIQTLLQDIDHSLQKITNQLQDIEKTTEKNKIEKILTDKLSDLIVAVRQLKSGEESPYWGGDPIW
jgi:hypothetical protein